ncbi:hypothetical protein VP1G_03256 [Cytospora mali]|uniref:Xylanolytic transcriptional activator regulatory domain-containing protein n=1 Tax=Cytospora mali TaxID=578113 RepID=A0A194UW82_CYTMA|nr:hypothetical protein VP1G_03256 [Valsa mali var. pyri (nom. inval.)]
MASRLGGVVVRMAYHLGLHRCPLRYNNFSPHEILMRKRIWWSFYCLERLVCQALGLPLDVQDDDVDVCYPTTEYHQTTKDGHAPYKNSPEGRQTLAPGSHQLQLLTLLAKHAQIRGMILELRHKSLHVRQDSVERALRVQSRLTKWANEVHEVITGEGTDNEDDAQEGLEAPRSRDDSAISPFYRTLLIILQHESTIALNRPLMAKKPATSASQAALQACIGASRALLETIDSPQPATINETSLATIVVWPLLTWSVWMSCFILTYAALEGVTSVSSAQKYAKRSLRILKQLSKRGTVWPDSCAQAVEHLISALERRKLKPTAVPDNNDAQTQDSTPTNNRSRLRDSTGQKTHKRARPAQRTDTTGSSSRPRAEPQHDESQFSHFVARPQDATRYYEQLTEPGALDAGVASTSYFMPESPNVFMGISGQDWLDPLSALDFSNFAQADSADSAMGFGFY